MERKGICKNVGVCSQAGKVQVITDDDAEFICTECGSPLEEAKEEINGSDSGSGDGKKKKLIIVIASAVVVIGGAIGAVLGINGSKENAVEETALLDSLAKVREADSIRVADSIRMANEMQPEETPAEVAVPEKKTQGSGNNAASGSSNLGWGTYSGPMQGGKPHGVGGTIKVKQDYSIDLKDGRGSTLDVHSGETIENTKFENGRLRAGELHRADGTRKWFNC